MQWPPLRTLSRRTAPAHPLKLLPPIMEVPVPNEPNVVAVQTTHGKPESKPTATRTDSDDAGSAAHGYLPPVEMPAPVLDLNTHDKPKLDLTSVDESHQEPVVTDPDLESEPGSTTNPADQRATSPSSSNADSGLNHSDVDDIDPYYWDVSAVDGNIDAYYCYDMYASASSSTPAHAARATVPDDDPYAWPPRAYNFNEVWRAAAASAAKGKGKGKSKLMPAAAPLPAPAPLPTPAPVPAAVPVPTPTTAVVTEETAVVMVDVRDESVAAPATTSAARAESVVDEDAAVADAIDMWKLVCQHYAVASALDARPATAASVARVR
ncbi:hypothetical protein AMAG_04449 [Allomyces macrogynus ATCC 38327]|uniref:Uncharacterized protein n=1 Tax=Allomyces macrogynus (strain ATCC 38327) TaxID=578462 RepID=A0A0L0S8W8_ALLM3|nr:hypothetical protein AMAG_04449 [Allomyces macrogynus ATCC 38327]|eukprot:KNE58912.1 hypothetical protein AMAG_04449 [Allomyces macrogynus ATCC 38327]